MQAATPTLAQIAHQHPSLGWFAQTLDRTTAGRRLEDHGPITVLAPTDDAFRRLPGSVVAGLLSEPEKLSALLRHHILPGRLDTGTLSALTACMTMQGQEVRITQGEQLSVSGAQIVGPAIQAENGLLYLIDRVILPRFPRWG